MVKSNALHLFLQPDPQININDNNAAPVTDGGYLMCPCCGGIDMRPVPNGGITLDGDGVTIAMYCADDCGDVTLDIVHPLGAMHLSWRHTKRGRKGA